MRPYRLLLLLLALLLQACSATGPVSLAHVRDFAAASTKLTAYGELSTRFRDTYQREAPYLTPAADRIAREADAKRRAAHGDFLASQKALALYMQTLAALAGDGAYDLTPQLDELGAGLQANTHSGLEQRHISAYTGLTRLLTRVIASGYQNRSVETMVRDGDEHVQVLLEGMTTLLRLYARTHENEKRTVLGLFEVELPLSAKPQDRMLVTLARVHYMSKANEYRLVDRRFDLAREGLEKIGAGHRTMRERLESLRGAEVRDFLRNLARDLRVVREGLTQS
jgi:hypothetical protein